MTKRASYIAVDPGKMSGVAFFDPWGRFTSAELPWPDVVRYLERTLLSHHRGGFQVRVSGERFDLLGTRGRQDEASWSLRILGCWQNEADRYGYEYRERGRAECKRLATNALLKALGWYLVGGEGHANDAARVLAKDLSLTDTVYWDKLVLGSGYLREESG